jgi:hypothetical protein
LRWIAATAAEDGMPRLEVLVCGEIVIKWLPDLTQTVWSSARHAVGDWPVMRLKQRLKCDSD